MVPMAPPVAVAMAAVPLWLRLWRLVWPFVLLGLLVPHPYLSRLQGVLFLLLKDMAVELLLLSAVLAEHLLLLLLRYSREIASALRMWVPPLLR